MNYICEIDGDWLLTEIVSNSYWIYNDPKIDDYVLNLRSRNKNEWKIDDVFVALAWKMGCIKGGEDTVFG